MCVGGGGGGGSVAKFGVAIESRVSCQNSDHSSRLRLSNYGDNISVSHLAQTAFS